MAQDFTSLLNTDKKQMFEYSGSTLIYQGQSEPGTLSSDAAWSIKKFIYIGDNLTEILWAEGTAEESNIWNNRATYTYS